MTGSASEIVFEALPVDDPQVRQPDITRARQVLGWEPEVAARGRACARLRRREPGRCESRCVGVAGGVAGGAPPALRRGRCAARRARRVDACSIGIYDEGADALRQPGHGLPAVTRQLHVQVIRREPLLGRPLGVAKHGPIDRERSRATPPTTGRSTTARVIYAARVRRSRSLFSINGTPRWANGGAGSNRAPTNTTDLRDFAVAAATRYSGTYAATDGRGCPPVRLWAAWNEPNNPVFLRPQYK